MFRVKNKEKGLALALEGGGARGAYQIGVVKALYENNVKFKSIVGTSIGAINAAYLVQDSFDEIYNMWSTLSFKDLFDLDEEPLKKLLKKEVDFDLIKYLSKKLNECIKIGGLDTEKMRNIVLASIDEEKIRKSDISLGLVTMCISDLTPEEKFIDDIEEGSLVDYIMATSNLPVFKRATVNSKKYIDGGVWDNCPVSMLEKKGYSDAIVIRAYKRNRIRGYNGIIKRDNIKMHMIEPSESLGSILNFDTNNLNHLLKLGYYDGLRFIKKLDGDKYYISKVNINEISILLNNINNNEIEEISNLLKINLKVGSNIMDELKNKIIPCLVLKTKNKKESSLKKSILEILEYVAALENIDRFKEYSFYDFVDILKESIKKSEHRNTNNEAIYKFIEVI